MNSDKWDKIKLIAGLLNKQGNAMKGLNLEIFQMGFSKSQTSSHNLKYQDQTWLVKPTVWPETCGAGEVYEKQAKSKGQIS